MKAAARSFISLIWAWAANAGYFGPSPNSNLCYFTEAGYTATQAGAVTYCSGKSLVLPVEIAGQESAEWQYIVEQSDAIHGLSDQEYANAVYQPSFWIGYKKKLGVWKDAAGNAVTSPDWKTGEPGTDACAGITKFYGWQWNGLQCTARQYVVCQGPCPAEIPTTTTAAGGTTTTTSSGEQRATTSTTPGATTTTTTTTTIAGGGDTTTTNAEGAGNNDGGAGTTTTASTTDASSGSTGMTVLVVMAFMIIIILGVVAVVGYWYKNKQDKERRRKKEARRRKEREEHKHKSHRQGRSRH